MTIRLLVPMLLMAVLAGIREGSAQGAGACVPGAAAGDTAGAKPLVVLRASAHAEEVRFGSRPEVGVRLSGCVARDTVQALERRNLPRPVQPGQTYRDVAVGVEIRSYLSVECLLGARAGGTPPDTALLQGAPELARLCAAADPVARSPAGRP